MGTVSIKISSKDYCRWLGTLLSLMFQRSTRNTTLPTCVLRYSTLLLICIDRSSFYSFVYIENSLLFNTASRYHEHEFCIGFGFNAPNSVLYHYSSVVSRCASDACWLINSVNIIEIRYFDITFVGLFAY